MRIIFLDSRLAAIRSTDAARLGFPMTVIKACRNKLIFLESAPDERTLRNWKSLHYEKMKGNREEHRSIRLNDQWRLVFKLNETTNPSTIEIVSIVDYH